MQINTQELNIKKIKNDISDGNPRRKNDDLLYVYYIKLNKERKDEQFTKYLGWIESSKYVYNLYASNNSPKKEDAINSNIFK